ncbi:MAG: PIN domain-containing protein [Alphaproteobacteria bacterium]|nr:PIN domain-containing protein [Alphaproteobacteria bacterium]
MKEPRYGPRCRTLIYLLDTNVLSELQKGSRCNARVDAWFSSVADDELFLSVVVIGEIRRGIERLRSHEAH